MTSSVNEPRSYLAEMSFDRKITKRDERVFILLLNWCFFGRKERDFTGNSEVTITTAG